MQDLGGISSSQLKSSGGLFRAKKWVPQGGMGSGVDRYKWSDMGYLYKWPQNELDELGYITRVISRPKISGVMGLYL